MGPLLSPYWQNYPRPQQQVPISQVQNIGLGLICYKIVQLKLSVTHLKGINDLNRRARGKGFLFIL